MKEFTLHDLGIQPNGERRWKIMLYGPIAYLTCDESMANFIVSSMNAASTEAGVRQRLNE